jgi:hypothetical protein
MNKENTNISIDRYYSNITEDDFDVKLTSSSNQFDKIFETEFKFIITDDIISISYRGNFTLIDKLENKSVFETDMQIIPDISTDTLSLYTKEEIIRNLIFEQQIFEDIELRLEYMCSSNPKRFRIRLSDKIINGTNCKILAAVAHNEIALDLEANFHFNHDKSKQKLIVDYDCTCKTLNNKQEFRLSNHSYDYSYILNNQQQQSLDYNELVFNLVILKDLLDGIFVKAFTTLEENKQ